MIHVHSGDMSSLPRLASHVTNQRIHTDSVERERASAAAFSIPKPLDVRLSSLREDKERSAPPKVCSFGSQTDARERVACRERDPSRVATTVSPRL